MFYEVKYLVCDNMDNGIELAMKAIQAYGKATKDPNTAYELMNFGLALSEEMYDARKKLGITQDAPALPKAQVQQQEVIEAVPMSVIGEGLCPSCGKKISGVDFRDDGSRQEFKISGTCQGCQDAMFGGLP